MARAEAWSKLACANMDRKTPRSIAAKLSTMIAALALAAAGAGCARDAKPALPPWQAPASMPWRERIDHEWPVADNEVGRAVSEGRIIGAEVAMVTKEGWSARGYGRGVGQYQPNETTLFEIGSVSKVFTGTLLADMVLKGEVSLVQPAQSLLPSGVQMPRSYRPITLMDLATHMSGFPRMPPNWHPRNKKDPYSDYGTDQLYAALPQTRLDAEPGQEDSYSNYGVGLLGQLLVNRAGAPDYESLVRARILGPLGMNDTSIVLRGDQQARFAWPYDKEQRRTSPWNFTSVAGAGGIRSTVRDMSVFLQGVMNTDSPISAASREALTPRGTPRKGEFDQGLGWVVRRDRGMAYHNGSTGGFHSWVGIDLAGSVGIIVLCNTASDDIDGIGKRILKRIGPSIGTAPIGANEETNDPTDDGADDLGIDVERMLLALREDGLPADLADLEAAAQ